MSDLMGHDEKLRSDAMYARACKIADTAARALAESHAERDRLTAELAKVGTELELYSTWIALDPTDKAIRVAVNCDSEEGSWIAIFPEHDRDMAEQFVRFMRGETVEPESMTDLTILEGTVTAPGMNAWNEMTAARRPKWVAPDA